MAEHLLILLAAQAASSLPLEPRSQVLLSYTSVCVPLCNQVTYVITSKMYAHQVAVPFGLLLVSTHLRFLPLSLNFSTRSRPGANTLPGWTVITTSL